jgi:hypothetical protein
MEAETAAAAARQRQQDAAEASAKATAAQQADAPASEHAELNKKAEAAEAKAKAARHKAVAAAEDSGIEPPRLEPLAAINGRATRSVGVLGHVGRDPDPPEFSLGLETACVDPLSTAQRDARRRGSRLLATAGSSFGHVQRNLLNGEGSRHEGLPCAWQPDSAQPLQSGQPDWRDPSNRLSSDTPARARPAAAARAAPMACLLRRTAHRRWD